MFPVSAHNLRHPAHSWHPPRGSMPDLSGQTQAAFLYLLPAPALSSCRMQPAADILSEPRSEGSLHRAEPLLSPGNGFLYWSLLLLPVPPRRRPPEVRSPAPFPQKSLYRRDRSRKDTVVPRRNCQNNDIPHKYLPGNTLHPHFRSGSCIPLRREYLHIFRTMYLPFFPMGTSFR